MQITLKLYASLSDYLPASAFRNQLVLEVPDTATPQSVLLKHNVPLEMAHLVLINGSYIAPEQRDSHLLQANDVLAVWPPVAGG